MSRCSRALAVLALAAGAPLAIAGDVTGTFRLSKDIFCVGEPILVEFSVTSVRASAFSFREGGDYRGTLRHDQYSFRVVNAAGRDFAQELRGNMGGLATEMKLEAGQTFRSSQLLNGWIRVLPPGKYSVHCERKLRPWEPKEADRSDEIAIRQDLSFEVIPYDRERIVAAIAAMHDTEKEQEASRKGAVRFTNVPIGWAIWDLSEKLATGLSGVGVKDREFEEAVLGALPKAWDDRYYLEYDFRANRCVLGPGKPEEFQLTIRARNNGAADLPHGLAESSLSVNDVAVAAWPGIVRERLEQERLGSTLAPGSVAEITGTFNDVLPATGKVTIVWTIGGVKRSVHVQLGP